MNFPFGAIFPRLDFFPLKNFQKIMRAVVEGSVAEMFDDGEKEKKKKRRSNRWPKLNPPSSSGTPVSIFLLCQLRGLRDSVKVTIGDSLRRFYGFCCFST